MMTENQSGNQPGSIALFALKRVLRMERIFAVVGSILWSAAIGIVIGILICLLFKITGVGLIYWVLFIPMMAICVFLLAVQPWKIDLASVSRLMNTKYAVLNSSCHLLLGMNRETGILHETLLIQEKGLLESLQLRKLDKLLPPLVSECLSWKKNKKIKSSILLFIDAILFSVALILYKPVLSNSQIVVHSINKKVSIAKLFGKGDKKLLETIKRIQVFIHPPAYSHLPDYHSDSLPLKVLAGSEVSWTFYTSVNANSSGNVSSDNANILLNLEGRTLKAHKSEQNKFQVSAIIKSPGLYRIQQENRISEPYAIELEKDFAPEIKVYRPGPFTIFEFGDKLEFEIAGKISDDFGIANGFIHTTIVKGSGEAVKFSEKKILLSSSFSRFPKDISFKKMLSLANFGISPGDEVYLYLEAIDNLGQKARSDVLSIKLADTSENKLMVKLSTGTNIKPEFFRSERQIIIESEQLIHDRIKISVEAFKNKSNDLGMDQKLLRLRYGKFLGEESESVIGEDPQDGSLPFSAAKSNTSDYGNSAKVMDEYTDKHDNAEDNSFFDTSTKTELKAILSLMWKAELSLRSYKPKDALPNEYSALKLLKIFQEKSRAYVPKTAFTAPTINEKEKRLSGDIKQIYSSNNLTIHHLTSDSLSFIKLSLEFLDSIRTESQFQNKNLAAPLPSLRVSHYLPALKKTEKYLLNLAASDPARYLPAWRTLHNLMLENKQISRISIAFLEEKLNLLQKDQPIKKTLKTRTKADALENRYLNLLNKS